MRCLAGCMVIAAFALTLSIAAPQNAAPPQAPPPPTPPAAAKTDSRDDAAVEQLIADLGSEDYRTREKAGRDLVARGEKVLPSLRAALMRSESPEVQRRLLVMVRQMDYDRLVAPKLVTMSLKDKTVKDAFAEISRQTGYKVEYNGNRGAGEAKQNFEFDKVPFWQALDKVAGTTGCSIANDNGEEGVIQIYNQDTLNPFVAYAGPFRIVATNISSNKNLQLSGINRRVAALSRQEIMTLNLQILSEPKNPMLSVTKVDLVSAVDELGSALTPPQDPNNQTHYYYNNGMFRGHNTFGNVVLSRADKAANTIKSLKARARIVLLSGTTPEITVNNPLKVEKKTFVGRTVEIEFTALTEDANNKGHYSLELTMKKLGGNDPNGFQDFNWINSAWQKVEVVDAGGNHYQTFGPNSINNNNGSSVQVSIPFGPENRRGQSTKLGPPVKVLINEWISVVHEVTFEFQDLPLP